MGVCSSEVSEPQSTPIKNTVVLLGSAGSGKSTLSKQLLISFGAGFSEGDYASFGRIIRTRVLEYMQTLIEESKTLHERAKKSGGGSAASAEEKSMMSEAKFELGEKGAEMAETVLKADAYVENANPLSGINSVGELIAELWKNTGIQAVYSQRKHFKKRLNENAKFFLDKVKDIAHQDYRPTVEDILRCRQRTVGHIECAIEYQGMDCSVYDLGGQWDERRSWIPFINRCSSILFVVDTSSYDESLQEDRKKNKMSDALLLFEQIASMKAVERKPIVLFLNKMDLFTEKIKEVPINRCEEFAEYEGDLHDEEENLEYITGAFFSRAPAPKNARRILMHHCLCALDTEAVSKIFESVLSSIVQTSLERGGLLRT
eukprot:jgi/Bigna1/56239/estExt_Genewise1Plus.C_890014